MNGSERALHRLLGAIDCLLNRLFDDLFSLHDRLLRLIDCLAHRILNAVHRGVHRLSNFVQALGRVIASVLQRLLQIVVQTFLQFLGNLIGLSGVSFQQSSRFLFGVRDVLFQIALQIGRLFREHVNSFASEAIELLFAARQFLSQSLSGGGHFSLNARADVVHLAVDDGSGVVQEGVRGPACRVRLLPQFSIGTVSGIAQSANGRSKHVAGEPCCGTVHPAGLAIQRLVHGSELTIQPTVDVRHHRLRAAVHAADLFVGPIHNLADFTSGPRGQLAGLFARPIDQLADLFIEQSSDIAGFLLQP